MASRGLLGLYGAAGRGGEGAQAFLKPGNSHLSSINAVSPDYDRASPLQYQLWDSDPRRVTHNSSNSQNSDSVILIQPQS